MYAFGSTGMWGSGALFVRAFSSPVSFNRKSVAIYDNRLIDVITK